MSDECLFDDPVALTAGPDPQDLRWGLALPNNYLCRRTYGMTDDEYDLYLSIHDRLNRIKGKHQ